MDKLLHIEQLIAQSENLEKILNSETINNDKDLRNIISELLKTINELKDFT